MSSQQQRTQTKTLLKADDGNGGYGGGGAAVVDDGDGAEELKGSLPWHTASVRKCRCTCATNFIASLSPKACMLRCQPQTGLSYMSPITSVPNPKL